MGVSDDLSVLSTAVVGLISVVITVIVIAYGVANFRTTANFIVRVSSAGASRVNQIASSLVTQAKAIVYVSFAFFPRNQRFLVVFLANYLFSYQTICGSHCRASGHGCEQHCGQWCHIVPQYHSCRRGRTCRHYYWFVYWIGQLDFGSRTSVGANLFRCGWSDVWFVACEFGKYKDFASWCADLIADLIFFSLANGRGSCRCNGGTVHLDQWNCAQSHFYLWQLYIYESILM